CGGLGMTPPATQPPCSASPSAIWIRGGDGAPERARKHVLARLNLNVSRAQAADAALIASELVTNSVIHAGVGVHQVVFLEMTTLGDRLRITVSDPGSEFEPRLIPAEPSTPGGFGLRLVDHLCSAWGVVRDDGRATRVWCDFRLDPA